MATQISKFWLKGEKTVVITTTDDNFAMISTSEIVEFMESINFNLLETDIIDFLNDECYESQATAILQKFIDKIFA